MSVFEPIIYIDRSEIRNGKVEELKTSIKELAELVKNNEPRIISYNAYFIEESNSLSVIHIHPDSASLEHHGQVAGPAFSKFVNLVKLLTIDIYGQPSNVAIEQLRKKANLLGNATLAVHRLHAGFSRFGVR
jgi:hypothetical protein